MQRELYRENRMDEHTETDVTTVVTEETQETEPQAPSQPTRTEREKAEFSLKKNAERLKELGGDPTEILGLKPSLQIDTDIPDDTPLTVGSLREIQKQESKKTAIELAEKLEDPIEKQRVLEILNRLSPSGDAQADLALARGSANSKKNAEITQEVLRTTEARQHGSGSGAPAKVEEQVTDLSPDELALMRAPFNLTIEEIKGARKRDQAK